MSASPWIVDVTEENFQQLVVDPCQQIPILVDFWATWCEPCLALGPVLERLTLERNGRVVLAKVNVDEARELAQYFGISSIPAVKVFYQGQIIHEFEGALPEENLRELFDQLAPNEDPALSQAKDAEQASPQKAEQQYRALVEQQPDNTDARLGLARALLALDELDEIESVLEPLEVSGEVGAESDRIRAVMYLARASRDLPDESALARTVSAEPKNAQARLDLGMRQASRASYEKALATIYSAAELDAELASGKAREVMVKVFYALGTSHPLANEYRGKLARLLY